MAYNKRYLLTKIIEIQTIVLEAKKRGVTQTWIYRNLVADKYHISESTYNNYLAINAKRELDKLLREQERCNQLKMF